MEIVREEFWEVFWRNGEETALGRLGEGFLCNFSSRVSTSGGC